MTAGMQPRKIEVSMRARSWCAAVGMITFTAWAQDQAPDPLLRTAQALFAPLPEVMLDPDRPFSQELVDLGKMLYYDPRLSLSGFVSCNSCHNLATYGVDNLPTSIGHRWAVGPRNSPTVLNAALHRAQFWDGRAADVEEQAQVEMAMPHADFTVERLASMPGYVEAFAAAYPDVAEPLTYVNDGRRDRRLRAHAGDARPLRRLPGATPTR
jgi:cytochrome c peroxidase